MLKSIWGKKIGMTQLFSSDNKVIPATVIHVNNLIVLQRKTTGRDGYEAVKIGCPRKESLLDATEKSLLNDKKNFSFIREIKCEENDSFQVGVPFELNQISIQEGNLVNVTGKTIGKGFQGCVKRHGFTGGRGSHGDKLGRRPGSLSGLRTCGRVFKGKKMPGHMGTTNQTVSNLEVIQYRPQENILIVKGSIPGKAGSLVYIEKCE